jgi:hypothetical protein
MVLICWPSIRGTADTIGGMPRGAETIGSEIKADENLRSFWARFPLAHGKGIHTRFSVARADGRLGDGGGIRQHHSCGSEPYTWEGTSWL